MTLKSCSLVVLVPLLLRAETPLQLAPGKVDDLSFDRGWVSTDREPDAQEEAADPETDADTPEMLAASMQTAGQIGRLLSQPPGLYFEKRAARLRIDNAGEGNRFLGTSAFTTLGGDFVVEFEVTAPLVGASPARFGLSDTPKQLLEAQHALFIEYSAFDPRKPCLRLMERTPDTMRELGRIADIGRLADKLIRLQRKGGKVSLIVQQDYILEGSLEVEAAVDGDFGWLGAHFLQPVKPKSDQRTIVYVDNIRGLDPEKQDPEAASPPSAFEFRNLGDMAWPPRILAGGMDVTSEAYAARCCLSRPLKLERRDLSAAANWPNCEVAPGTVACDPATRRVKFSDGEPREIRRIGSIDFLRGVPRHVVVKDGFAYLAHGDGGPSSHFVIIDVTQPDSPKVVAGLGLKWWPEDLDVANGIAYVADGFLLHVIDVRDPKSPKLLATYTKDLGLGKGEARCVAVAGELAFVGAEKLGLIVLNVSNPASPELVGTAREELRRPLDIAVKDRLVWLASEDGLLLFDVSKPEKPKRVRSGKAEAARKAEDDGGVGLGLDTPAPAEPPKSISLKELQKAAHPLRLAMTEEYLYVADKKEGLLVFDITDPWNPEAVGAYKPSEGEAVKGVEVHATSVFIAGETAYLTVNHGFVPQKPDEEDDLVQVDVGGGLHVLNVADPLEPLLMGRYAAPGSFISFVDVTGEGNKAYVSDAAYGLWVIDASDERQPARLGGVPTQGEIRDMAIEGNVAYLASGGGQGVLAVDIANPSLPKLLGRYHAGFDTPSAAVHEGIVYTGGADWSIPHGLHVVSFREPDRPKQEAVIPARPASQWMNCGGLLYGSSGDVFDLTDPMAPEPYGKLPTGVLLRSEGLLYIAHSNVIHGLTVVDPRRPSDPLLAQLRLFLDSGGRGAIRRRGDLLFIAGGTVGVAIVDVKAPGAPEVVKILKSNIGSAVDVAPYGRYLVVTDLYSGIKLYDATIPAQPRLRAIYPAGKDPHEPGGYCAVVRDGLLYRARLNGLDVLALPLPPEAPEAKVTIAPK
jgi:hypothetical protein